MNHKFHENHAKFEIVKISDTFILLFDQNAGGRSMTNDATWVIDRLRQTVPDGIGKRRVYYRDTMDRYDEMILDDQGRFLRFSPCTQDQQKFFKGLGY